MKMIEQHETAKNSKDEGFLMYSSIIVVWPQIIMWSLYVSSYQQHQSTRIGSIWF